MANIGNYSISQIGDEIAAMGHGNTLNQIVNLYGVYNRAARRMMEDVDLQETRVVASFGKVYNSVWDYPVFTDMKGNSIADFYPQANRTSLDDYGSQYGQDFDLQKNYSVKPDFSVKYNAGERTLRVNAPNLPSGTQINPADNVSDNGTWTSGGGASAPISNSVFYTDGVTGSVQVNLSAGQTVGNVKNTTVQALDLTNNYNSNANIFFWVYLPTASAFTSIALQMGSSTANYYTQTGITTDFMGNAFVNGWNLISIPFTSMTVAGTPVLTSITYLDVIFNYNGTQQVGVLINQFYARIGVLFNTEYYSKYLFRDGTTGIFQEQVTADTNIVNLDTDGLNLFIFASGAEATQQMQGLDALFYDSGDFENRYQTSLANYKNKYKGEKTKPHAYYYNQPRAGYRRYMSSSFGLPPA